MVWVGRDLIDHPVPTPLPWAGTPSTRPGYSELHPTWPGRGQPQLLWATWSSAWNSCNVHPCNAHIPCSSRQVSGMVYREIKALASSFLNALLVFTWTDSSIQHGNCVL